MSMSLTSGRILGVEMVVACAALSDREEILSWLRSNAEFESICVTGVFFVRTAAGALLLGTF